MRVAILAPISSSYYSRLVTWLVSQESGLEAACVIVRTPWSVKRIRSELRRDGVRLLRKAHRKLVLRESSFAGSPNPSIADMARTAGMPALSIGKLAQSLNIPFLSVKDHNDERAIAFLREHAPDVAAFTGGGLIRRDVLAATRLGVLNCHMGILPRFRGMDVVEWPFVEPFKDRPETGLTLHFMDEGLDTGPILIKCPMPIGNTDRNFADFRVRLEAAMPETMLDGLRGLRDKVLQPRAQAEPDGRQYFVMHARIAAAASRRLAEIFAGDPEVGSAVPD